MSSRTAFRAAATVLAVVMAAGVAHADTTPASTITQMKIVAEASPSHRLFHGAVWLEHDMERYNYRWGGAHCSASLSDAKVSILFQAFEGKYSVSLDYVEKLYKGNRYRCVTGFTVRR